MKLIAEASEENLGRRTALYHMTVKSEDGMLIASSQGMAYRKTEELV
jgi:acyl-coenzyme A thioesterase PaaI-like protein